MISSDGVIYGSLCRVFKLNASKSKLNIVHILVAFKVSLQEEGERQRGNNPIKETLEGSETRSSFLLQETLEVGGESSEWRRGNGELRAVKGVDRGFIACYQPCNFEEGSFRRNNSCFSNTGD